MKESEVIAQTSEAVANGPLDARRAADATPVATFTKSGDRVVVCRFREYDAALFFEEKFNHLAQVVNAMAFSFRGYPPWQYAKDTANNLEEAVRWLPGQEKS
jgi:hypothetical protein